MNLQDKPLVSVVVSFLNEEKFLAEAVESVLQQSYTNWELILVDDGSSDKSTSIAQKYEEDYPGKVYYSEHEGHINKGLSASRNQGIKQAKGELVAFLDADDVWLPEKLEKQVSLFRQNPGIAMVAEASLYWSSWNAPDKEDVLVPVGAPQNKVYQPAGLIPHLYPLGKGPSPCPSALILTKAALERVGGFEEEFRKEYQLYEDQAFLHKVYLKEKVYISSDCNNKYRQRVGSIVDQVHADGHYHRVRNYFLEWLDEYIKKEQINDATTELLLKKALFPYRHPQAYYLINTVPRKVKAKVKKVIRKLTK